MFQEAGMRPATARGQNFLLDKNQVNLIARLGDPGPDDLVLEVGPGTGFLSEVLAPSGCTVLGVDVDRKLLQIASKTTKDFPNVILMQADILKNKNEINPAVVEKVEELLKARGPGTVLKSISNLPYSAGTPFVANLFSSPLPWKIGIFMLQLEVAKRITAAPDSSAYGSLSISAAFAGKAKLVRKVPPQVFWPRPKVDSAIVSIEFLSPEERLKHPWKHLRKVTSAVFCSRRKTLKNALKGCFEKDRIPEVMTELDLDPSSRGSEMTPEQFMALAWKLREIAETP